MALKIYPEALPSNSFSQEGDMSNPLREAFDGSIGGTKETKYYLRNDDSLYNYSGITMTPLETQGRSITDGTDGYGWKLRVGDTQPTQDEWDLLSYGNTITFDDISDIATYLPFWIKIDIPRGAVIESHEDVILRVNATEILI